MRASTAVTTAASPSAAASVRPRRRVRDAEEAEDGIGINLVLEVRTVDGERRSYRARAMTG
ncbi:hypothetical protein TPA0905_39070 [Streptomyces olivaceus]|nr:hypothetical protein TPA0905_39070 [Streptomyces olivaceus]